MSIVEVPLEVIRNIRPRLFGRKRIEIATVKLSADQLLEESIRENAVKIAAILSATGEKKFGPMWSETSGVLPDGRKVHLQSSVDALEIHFEATEEIPHTTHVRYDLTAGRVSAYEIRQPDNRPIIFYNGSPKNIYPPSVDIIKSVGGVLAQVEPIVGG